MTRITFPADVERSHRLSMLKLEATLVSVHLNHLRHTEPPGWVYITEQELSAISGTLKLLSLQLQSIRLRANVDNGPYSGRDLS